MERAAPGAMTPDVEAMGQFGGAVSTISNEFVLKMREAREASEYYKAENSWKEGINQFKSELDTDYKTYSERFEKKQAELNKKISSNITELNAQKAFKRFVDADLVTERYDLGRKARQLEINDMAAGYYKDIELAIKRGDIGFINRSTAAAVQEGYLKADVAERAKENALHKVAYDFIWQTAIEMEDEKSAIEFIEQAKGVTPGERNSLLTAASRHFTAEAAREKEEIEAQREQQRTTLLPKLREGSITSQDIYEAGFDTNEEKRWFDWMDTRNKAIAAGKSDPLTETNDAVYGNMSERVNRYPETVTKDDIWALHSKGLSTDDCEKLTKRLDSLKEDTVKAQGLKRSHTSLSKLKNQGIFGEGTEAEKVWGEKANALDHYVDTHPDATNEDITKFTNDLVEEEKSNFFGKMLDYLMLGTGVLPFAVGDWLLKRPGELDAERAKALIKEAGGDKEKARKIAKERGYEF